VISARIHGIWEIKESSGHQHDRASQEGSGDSTCCRYFSGIHGMEVVPLDKDSFHLGPVLQHQL